VNFENKRRRQIRRFHDELATDERLLCSRENFRVKVFLVTLHTCIGQLDWRFRSLQLLEERFGFLMPVHLFGRTEEELCSSAANFARLYESDVSEEVTSQFLCLREYLKSCAPQMKSPRDILQFIVTNRLQGAMPDVVTSYLLYLTLPVSVASCERSFSKLRLIKNYLRSACGQQRLSHLALLSIESATARNLDFNALIHEFASKKARKCKL
jgi:hypothetical protein